MEKLIILVLIYLSLGLFFAFLVIAYDTYVKEDNEIFDNGEAILPFIVISAVAWPILIYTCIELALHKKAERDNEK